MIDPVKATDYDRTDDQLEEFLLFCIAVAGKHAGRTAINLERLLQHGRKWADASPFQIIQILSKKEDLPQLMKNIGFGCFNLKARGLLEASTSGIDLRNCLVEELEELMGIGMKTARYFVLHTRRNARLACLDTHIKRWLSHYTGYDVPKGALTRNKYLELEQAFLKIADAMKISPTDLDLKLWNSQRDSGGLKEEDEELLAATA